jgi:peptidoglycan/xylan/chitin deacetylase (PgdA/CDA1 family)
MKRRLRLAAVAIVLGVTTAVLPVLAEPAGAASYSNSRCGNTSNRVLLTFDDWAYGDPYRATRVGGYLQSRNVRAAFFLINQNARNYPNIVNTLRRQGHWVLNHTYSHPNLTRLSSSGVDWQIRNGVSSNLLRPPYGAYNSRVSSVAASRGYRICTWTIDTRDWQKPDGRNYRSTASIRSIVRNSSWSAKSGGVVLGHLVTNYPNAVGGIIDDLHRQGLLFCRNRGPVSANAPFPLACT